MFGDNNKNVEASQDNNQSDLMSQFTARDKIEFVTYDDIFKVSVLSKYVA
jgi:hypothetical protein